MDIRTPRVIARRSVVMKASAEGPKTAGDEQPVVAAAATTLYKQIKLRLDEDLVSELDEIANAMNLSRNAVVKIFLRNSMPKFAKGSKLELNIVIHKDD